LTTVRGKAPLEAQWNPDVVGNCYSEHITIKSGLWQGKQRVEVHMELSVYAAAELVRGIRKELRRIRDDKTAMLTAALNKAEGPL
jgi:hypothetical protein